MCAWAGLPWGAGTEGLLSHMVEVSGQQGRSRGLSPSQPAIGKTVAPVLQHQVQ